MDEKELEFVLECAKEAAKLGGKIVKEYYDRFPLEGFSTKGISDWVTEADKESERQIKKFLMENFPADFLGEEFGEANIKTKKRMRWIVDPLDGTKNFTKKIPYFCVSVAFEYEGIVRAGAVFCPTTGEFFWAAEGKGAFMNGKKISVSDTEDFTLCMIGTGLPFRSKEFIEPYLKSFRTFFLMGGSIRNLGSAALELCYVASGNLDGFWELGLSPWDMAAGSVIIKEAGGKVTDFWGGNDFMQTGCIVASNGKIHNILVRITSEVFKSI